MSVQGSSYISSALDKQGVKNIIKSFKACLKDEIWGEFDTLACIGTSGLLIAPILALECDKKLLVVRKEKDNSHSFGRLEGHDDSKKYIIIDDFVCSGSTLENIVTTVESGFKQEWRRESPIYLGCYFWSAAYQTVSQKLKISIGRYDMLCANKVFAQRTEKGKKYAIDKYVEPND